MAKSKTTAERPYTTDYGTTKGHCRTKESALIAALTRIIHDKLSHVTIEGPGGKAIARIRRDSFWGIFITPVRGKQQYVAGSGWEPLPGIGPDQEHAIH